MADPVYRFCPLCAGRLEARRLKDGDPERLVCSTCGHVLYLDPKVAVGTIIRGRDDRIVLVRRAIEPGYGKWVFPGGYVDRGEPPEAAAVREAREEAGLVVRLEGLVNIYAYPNSTPIIIVYSAVALAGTLCVDEECLEAAWFGQPDIPWGRLAFRSTHEGLRDYFEKGLGARG